MFFHRHNTLILLLCLFLFLWENNFCHHSSFLVNFLFSQSNYVVSSPHPWASLLYPRELPCLYASIQALTLVLLTLLPSQLLFYLQHHLVCVFNHSDYLHIELILNFVPQAINVSGNFIFVSFPLSISNVQLIELLCVLLHSQSSLSQVLHPPEQTYLVILGYEFLLQLATIRSQLLIFCFPLLLL